MPELFRIQRSTDVKSWRRCVSHKTWRPSASDQHAKLPTSSGVGVRWERCRGVFSVFRLLFWPIAPSQPNIKPSARDVCPTHGEEPPKPSLIHRASAPWTKLSTSMDVGVMWGVACASVYVGCSAALPSCALICSDVVSSHDVPLFSTSSFSSSSVKIHCSKMQPNIANALQIFALQAIFSSTSVKKQFQCETCTDNTQIRSIAKIRRLSLQCQRHPLGRQNFRRAMQNMCVTLYHSTGLISQAA